MQTRTYIAIASCILLFSIMSIFQACEKQELSPTKSLNETVLNLGSGLKAGTSRVSIMPETTIDKELVGYEPRISNGYNDTLSARCLILADDDMVCAIISLDIVNMHTNLYKRIRENIHSVTGISQENIFAHAIHTHSSPSLVDEDYWNLVIDKASNSAIQAMENAELAIAVVKTGSSDVNTVNRRNPERVLSNKFTWLEFKKRCGEPISSLLNFSCHPVVLGPSNKKITADYVHYLRAKMEQSIGGNAIFINGYEGNINPAVFAGTFDQAKAFGEAIALDMLSNITKSDTLVVTLTCNTLKTEVGDTDTQISVIDLGQLQIATIPGEPCDGVGMAIEGMLPTEYTMTFGLTNGGIGYIISADNWEGCTQSFLPVCYEETASKGKNTANIIISGFQRLRADSN